MSDPLPMEPRPVLGLCDACRQTKSVLPVPVYAREAGRTVTRLLCGACAHDRLREDAGRAAAPTDAEGPEA